jgi:hypothetical protein
MYVAAGVPPHWLAGDQGLVVRDAATLFGVTFGYTLKHDATARHIDIDIDQPLPPHVRMVHPCRLGPVRAATADGTPLHVTGQDVAIPGGARHIEITYG